tara:strand:- start:5476 stop:6594 length:1119 start_codon:yes stop_codon:yes gene_type:complete
MANSNRIEVPSDDLIMRFRDKVNQLSFVFFKYGNVDGQNLWSPICSCMDWISVAIRSLQNPEELSCNIDIRVMQIYSLISQIDIVQEAVVTLYSVFILPKGRKSPFKGCSKVFKDTEGRDDDTYFKELRAQFGAHPVNLKGGSERLYASWPYESLHGNCDLEVRLYSNLVDKKDRVIKLKVSELIAYLVYRYDYLNVLIEEIDQQYERFKIWCKETPIEKSNDTVEQLDILVQESKKRLNLDFIEGELNTLRMLFSVTCSEHEISEKEKVFKLELKELVAELHSILQFGDFNQEFDCGRILETGTLHSELSYELPKLYSWIYSNANDPLISYYFERLASIDNFGYCFSESDSRSQTLLKLYLFDRDLQNKAL